MLTLLQIAPAALLSWRRDAEVGLRAGDVLAVEVRVIERRANEAPRLIEHRPYDPGDKLQVAARNVRPHDERRAGVDEIRGARVAVERVRLAALITEDAGELPPADDRIEPARRVGSEILALAKRKLVEQVGQQ